MPADEQSAAVAQLEAVRRMWADAVRDVPHYAALAAAGAAPRVIETWDDFRAVPILTRRTIQEHPERFVRLSRAAHGTVKTGGSTATPLHLGMDRSERELMRIVKLAAWQELGYETSSRLFIIWGHSHLLGTGWKGRVNHARRRIGDALLGYDRVSAYRLSPAIAHGFAERLIRSRPAGVIGYASALDLFGRYTASYRSQFHDLGIRFVLSTTEPPPRPDTLTMLEDLFGCVVVQEYGGAEFGQVAFKRGVSPFQVYADLNFLEVEPAVDASDVMHPLLVTSLYPRYVPLIRYRNGDAVSGAQRGHHGHVHSFEMVAGRVNDVIHFADGPSIHSEAVLHCVLHERAVFHVQMVVKDDGIDLCLVTADSDRPALESRIRGRLAQVDPRLAAARFCYVDDVTTTRAGKRRWFVDQRTSPPCAASPAS